MSDPGSKKKNQSRDGYFYQERMVIRMGYWIRSLIRKYKQSNRIRNKLSGPQHWRILVHILIA
jgi:hypothetical protein